MENNCKASILAYVYRVVDRMQKYYVEVSFFFFFLARHMTLPLFQEFVQTHLYSQHGLNFYNSGNFTPTSEKWASAHHESILVVLGLQIAEGLPAIITIIIFGTLSDRTGRHLIMLWMPSLGSCLYCSIYILIQYTEWSIDGLFLASALRGLSGSMTAFVAGASFYAINSVTVSQRSSRLAIQEFLNGGAYAIGNLIVGFWVKEGGFLKPFWFSFMCSLIALIISFFLIEETKHTSVLDGQHECQMGNHVSQNFCTSMLQTMGKYFKCRHNPSLIKIWLVILAFQSYAFVHIGEENTLVLYLTGQPYIYSWQNSVTGASAWVKIGLLLSIIMAVAAVATAICTPVLKHFLSDTSIILLGLTSKAIGTLWIAFIQNETLIFFCECTFITIYLLHRLTHI